MFVTKKTIIPLGGQTGGDLTKNTIQSDTVGMIETNLHQVGFGVTKNLVLPILFYMFPVPNFNSFKNHLD